MDSVEEAQARLQRARMLVSQQQGIVLRRQGGAADALDLSRSLLETMTQSLALVRRAACLTSKMREMAFLVEGVKTANGAVRMPGGQQPVGEPRQAAEARALVEEERRRIARELHDTIGQQLAAMRLTSAELRSGSAPGTLKKRLAMLESQVAAADAELDRAVFALHPPALGEQGLVEAVSQHASLWSGLFGIPVDLLARGLKKTEPSTAVVASLYRIVQESLTNIAKHAGARHVGIVLSRQGRQLMLSIEDDGVGFAVTDRPLGRLGLVGMRERIEALGGTLEIESAPGQGTTVLASVDMRAEAGAATGMVSAGRSRQRRGAATSSAIATAPVPTRPRRPARAAW
ncbi:sensor histidine kinase [Azohydromonas aeria]|uniref:sensor histidine kinase n=1 Tax=Azohydromonas aeria TaxID=2590212 RepID=UPI0012F854DD|nr:sensor histidine kinase [Azohydromonas aeria]